MHGTKPPSSSNSAKPNPPNLQGGAVDIMKCFDQIQRDLLYSVARRAGFPEPALQAYQAYHEAVQCYNSISGAPGKPYHKPTSIPQGCPLSMVFIALLMVPWTKMVEAAGAIPRVLADDILVITQGPDPITQFKTVFDSTHQYLQDIGAKIAPDKSAVFASDPKHRRDLKKHIWPTIS